MVDLTSGSQIEVLSAADAVRRRYWSDADKLRIVEESLVGHRQVSATARRHGISRSLLTAWRRQYRNGELGGTHSPGFIPLMVSAGRSAQTSTAPLRSNPEAKIKITLANGRRVSLSASIDPAVLARLLPVLDGA
jgi:transposase